MKKRFTEEQIIGGPTAIRLESTPERAVRTPGNGRTMTINRSYPESQGQMLLPGLESMRS